MPAFEVLHNFVSPHRSLTIFDVGSHQGDSIESLLACFPRGSIVGFEPDPDNFTQLASKYAVHPRVDLHEKAVGDTEGWGFLHRNNYDATHSLIPIDQNEMVRWSDADDLHEIPGKKVALTSLDAFCANHEVPAIDILKLDIQGGELNALQGARRLLEAQAIGTIFCEVEFRSLYKNQPMFWDVAALLASMGYQLVSLVQTQISELGVWRWADAIFVNGALWRDIEAQHLAGRVIPR